MTEYNVVFHKKFSSLRFIRGTFFTLKEAKNLFNELCEAHPKDSFSIVKKQTIEEKVCESEDYRQSKFDFAV